MTSCSYTTKQGKRCHNPAKHDGLCVLHFRIKAAQASGRWERAKQIGVAVGAIAGGAEAVIKLVEVAVKVWEGLLFGPRPSDRHLESLSSRIVKLTGGFPEIAP